MKTIELGPHRAERRQALTVGRDGDVRQHDFELDKSLLWSSSNLSIRSAALIGKWRQHKLRFESAHSHIPWHPQIAEPLHQDDEFVKRASTNRRPLIQMRKERISLSLNKWCIVRSAARPDPPSHSQRTARARQLIKRLQVRVSLARSASTRRPHGEVVRDARTNSLSDIYRQPLMFCGVLGRFPKDPFKLETNARC